MLVECRLELCAESIEPSSTCAQLHAACILTIAYWMPGTGAQAGGSNSRICLLRAHPGPDEAAAFARRIGLVLHRLQQRCAAAGLRGHLEDVAVHVELPAVVEAAQAALLVAAEDERGAAVRAVLAEHAERPFVSRNTTRSSPSRRERTGAPSVSATSSDRHTGSQCRRMMPPIGASPSTRHSSSFCSGVSILRHLSIQQSIVSSPLHEDNRHRRRRARPRLRADGADACRATRACASSPPPTRAPRRAAGSRPISRAAAYATVEELCADAERGGGLCCDAASVPCRAHPARGRGRQARAGREADGAQPRRMPPR